MFDTETITLHGLTMDEYGLAVEILGRELNDVELGLLSAMWSEHCSYKSSKKHLGGFPTTGPQVIQGPGENAGVVDIGDGFAVVFKMESHNHPSYIEPYQGAATGVGGILRDVFTMGARPLASLNSIRFGEQKHPKTRYLVDGAVGGIAGYGNCIGVPTIGGELVFHKGYNGNCLVNAFNLGLVKTDNIFLGKAEGVGNPVMYVGSRTGRDGIHGATMASEEFDDTIEERRPTVQVGDPFTEKLLLEACLELFQTDMVVGIQDMGAAGMTSSSFEMAGRAQTGVELDLEKVPRREEGMTPYEIMLSESQERMLLVCHKGKEDAIKKIFDKWDLSAEVVGVVTSDGMVRLRDNGEVVAEMPAAPLSESAPVYDRPSKEPDNLTQRQTLIIEEIPEPKDITQTLMDMLGSPNLSSREWVYQQYDYMVRTNTLEAPGSDAGVIRIRDTRKGVAMSVDCNSRYCYLDPYVGGMQAVAEATRNVACSGAKPLAITDCLNFGSPEDPEVMWQFKEAIAGVSKACDFFKTPVVSGNVSFYNQTGDQSIHPTPTIGAVGLIEDHSKVTGQYFQNEGDVIIALGVNKGEIGGSEYLSFIHNIERGKPPEINLAEELALQNLLVGLADTRLIQSAHDISDGGQIVALAECCFRKDNAATLGFAICVNSSLRPDVFLFSESQSRAIVSVDEAKVGTTLELAKKHGVPAENIGNVTDGQVTVSFNDELVTDTSSALLMKPWKNSLPEYMTE